MSAKPTVRCASWLYRRERGPQLPRGLRVVSRSSVSGRRYLRAVTGIRNTPSERIFQ